MRVVGAGVTSGRGESRGSRSAGVDDAGIYRLRSASDAAWPGQFAYRRRETIWRRLGATIVAIGRLCVPVMLLLSALAASYINLDTRLPLFADVAGRWLTLGHALLPLSFLAVALANRRYGAAHAFAQVVIALAIVAGTVALAGDSLKGLLPQHAEPSFRFAAAFGVSFFLASFVSVLMFDAARGPRWWAAPLLGLEMPAFIFPVLFFPLAYAGLGDTLWTAHMLAYAGFLSAAAIVSLLPYWLLRAIIPPLSGFGGY